MASFQVEIVPSSPFFQSNLKNLDLADLWVHHPQWQTASTSASVATDAQCSNNANDAYDYSPEKPRDKWARAREIVFPANNTSPKASDNPNAGGVSSLVQKWRGFESGAKPPAPPPLPPGPLPIEDDSIIGDWESDRTVLSNRSSIRGRDSDVTESERLRVADIIRKLTPNEAGSVSPPRSSRTSLDQCMPLVATSRVRTSLDQCLPSTATSRVRTSFDQCIPSVATSRVRTSFDHQSDLRCIAPPPRIRGRQAYLDLLAQRERDKRKELEGLLGRQAVSKFSHRGRIQVPTSLGFPFINPALTNHISSK